MPVMQRRYGTRQQSGEVYAEISQTEQIAQRMFDPPVHA
jgi:hypothetical protein